MIAAAFEASACTARAIAAAFAAFDASANAALGGIAKARLVAELETPAEAYVCPACSGPTANHESTAFSLTVVCCCPCHGDRR